jgi:hypothetical protein
MQRRTKLRRCICFGGSHTMKRLLWNGRCRMYFNAYEEGPEFWSVDDGDAATEVKGTALHFIGCDFETVVQAERKVQPRAWIEVASASVWQGSDGSFTIESAVQIAEHVERISATLEQIAA